jgi:integrase
MATILERPGRRFRAEVRRGGHKAVKTFSSRQLADTWAKAEEARIEQIAATGVIPTKATVADLIDRYIEEERPKKQWGKTKTADLKRLRAALGAHRASTLTKAHIVNYFKGRANGTAGPVVVASESGYLIGVLKTARDLWSLDVPVDAAQAAIRTLRANDLAGKSKERDRRVTDAEINALIGFYEDGNKATDIPMADIIRFCVATGMRISEVCRLEWADLDSKAHTVVIRDRKHPTDKIGNDQTVPLLNATGFDAFAIVKRQPRTDDRIFPVNPKTVVTYFPRAVRALGFVDLHLHDLRHEAISRLFAAGFRITDVQLISGHRDLKMLSRYTHITASDVHAQAHRLKAA